MNSTLRSPLAASALNTDSRQRLRAFSGEPTEGFSAASEPKDFTKLSQESSDRSGFEGSRVQRRTRQNDRHRRPKRLG